MGADRFSSGPDTVQPVSSPSPLKEEDVDTIDEQKYADMLHGISTETSEPETSDVLPKEKVDSEKMDVNYEAMTLKELQSFGRQKGVSVHGLKKKEIIDSLRKKKGSAELEGADLGVQGFLVNLEESVTASASASASANAEKSADM